MGSWCVQIKKQFFVNTIERECVCLPKEVLISEMNGVGANTFILELTMNLTQLVHVPITYGSGVVLRSGFDLLHWLVGA